ncbi:hypothetical protein [Streptomyces sp900105755]|uniref:WYL domain-containing protein n=1 Tax=Streptomyces sp. 900105755 TaxID=3154389 RepID=A0ABV1TX25_9ACTN
MVHGEGDLTGGGGELAGSASRAIEIPDTIPPGPLRTWLEWLRELRRRADTPPLTLIAEATELRGQGVSVATIRRLLRGDTLNEGTGTAVAYVLAEMDRRPVASRPSADWDAFDVHLTSLLSAALAAHSQGTVLVQASDISMSVQVPISSGEVPRVDRMPSSEPVPERWARESTIWHVVGPNGKDPYEMASAKTIIEIMRSLRDFNDPGGWAARFFELAVEDRESFTSAMDKEYPGFAPAESEVTFAVFEGFQQAYIDEEGICLTRLQRDGVVHRDRFRLPIFDGAGRVILLLCGQQVGSLTEFSAVPVPLQRHGNGETLVVEVVGRVSPVINAFHRYVSRYSAHRLWELRDAIREEPGVQRAITWGAVK